MKNLNIFGVHWKIWFLVGIGVTKNQYRGGDCLKVGDCTVFRFRGGLGQKGEGGIFENGGLVPQCILRTTQKKSWKVCLNLCSCKWLRPVHSLVRYLTSLQWWQSKTLFGDDLINFNKLFLERPRLATFQKLGSNFFHSITVDRKK